MHVAKRYTEKDNLYINFLNHAKQYCILFIDTNTKIIKRYRAMIMSNSGRRSPPAGRKMSGQEERLAPRGFPALTPTSKAAAEAPVFFAGHAPATQTQGSLANLGRWQSVRRRSCPSPADHGPRARTPRIL